MGDCPSWHEVLELTVRQKARQALQAFCLNLADPLACHAVDLPHLLKRQRVAVGQAEPEINDTGLSSIQPAEAGGEKHP